MAKVGWRERALTDLQNIIGDINQFDPPAAQRFGQRLLNLGDSLTDFPGRGRPAGHGVREMTGVPPYILRYKIEEDTVIILSIRHGAQLSPTDD